MMDCCTPHSDNMQSLAGPAPTANSVLSCSECGAKGKLVDLQTVKALLAVSLEYVQSPTYYFCRTPTCPVVYYATEGTQAFTEVDLRERVYQKAPDDATVFVCYCFRYTLGALRTQVVEDTLGTPADRINAGIQAGLCACEIRNPQGSCCWGNVRAVVKQSMTQVVTQRD